MRATGDAALPEQRLEGELLFSFVLRGRAVVRAAGRAEPLAAGACFAVPGGTAYALEGVSGDLELFEVSCPAAVPGTA